MEEKEDALFLLLSFDDGRSLLMLGMNFAMDDRELASRAVDIALVAWRLENVEMCVLQLCVLVCTVTDGGLPMSVTKYTQAW